MHDQTPDTTPIHHDRPHAIGRYLAVGIAVGLIAGAVFGAVEPLLRIDAEREWMTGRLWAEALTFSVLTHQALWVVWCGSMSLVVGVLKGKWAGGPGRPWAAASGGLVAGILVILAMTAAAWQGFGFAKGMIGTVIALVFAVALTFPAAGLLAWLGRGRLGRLTERVGPIKATVAGVLTIVCIVAQVAWRSRIDTVSAMPTSTATNPSTRPGTTRPHIVLIVCDTLRADRLGCYGYDRPTSPHLDALAERALVFTHTVSPGIWTQPAHASFFTGLCRSQHGVGWNRIWLDDQFITLAEALSEHGYQTVALSNNPNVSPAQNLTQGFQTFIEPVRLAYATHGLPYLFMKHVVMAGGPLGSWLGRWFVYPPGGPQTVAVTEHVLAQRSDDRPLMLFINLMEPHQPFEPRRAYRQALVDSDELAHSFGIDHGVDAIALYNLTDRKVYSERDMKVLSQLYDARVRELDDVLAALMRVLDRHLDLDRTILVITSDHGESIGEHEVLGHQYCVYDTLARVPLIMRWPERLKPKRVDTWVQTSDLYPTLLTWVGIEPKQVTEVLARPLDESLRGGPMATYRSVVTEYLSPPGWAFTIAQRYVPHFDPAPWMVAYQGFYAGKHKMIVRSDGRNELYDLSSDPGEQRNLIRKRSDELKDLSRLYRRWRKSFKPFDPNTFTGPTGGKLDSDQRSRLRDLGYVQ